jgi:hypothetical protein
MTRSVGTREQDETTGRRPPRPERRVTFSGGRPRCGVAAASRQRKPAWLRPVASCEAAGRKRSPELRQSDARRKAGAGLDNPCLFSY